MHLSKVMISGSTCRNPYEIHRALWRLFPEDADAQRDFLFRVEHSGQQSAEVLLQSIREPLPSPSKEVRLVACKEYPLLLRAGQRLRFLLVANPVKTIADEHGRLKGDGQEKKCRVPLLRDEDRQTWLTRKLNGFAVVEIAEVEKRPVLNFHKIREKRIGKIQPVVFQGILQVLNQDEFRNQIIKGIGPAKAFGCGLLSLARI
ncbi:MAG: type I-E CRISPR-associated protein Cas6/Cse3/CasE [Syntrophaceae bacterium]|nr:type I-E CRISPR-associated protein Cas6/Cse3/CasE [Syntrophaceae bacterium]